MLCPANLLQAAVEVGAEDAARLAELSKQLSKETAQLAKLRASCDGLQKKAAALQVGFITVSLLVVTGAWHTPWCSTHVRGCASTPQPIIMCLAPCAAKSKT